MQPGKHEIRQATEADIPAVLACLAAAFEPYRAAYTPAAYQDTVLDRNTIRHRMHAMRVLVAIADGEVVGTLAWSASGPEGHLRGMAVDPAWQGSGVASDLMQAAEDALGRAGCTRVTVDTTRPLERAGYFYRRHGYAPTGEVSDFFGMLLHRFAKPLPGLH